MQVIDKFNSQTNAIHRQNTKAYLISINCCFYRLPHKSLINASYRQMQIINICKLLINAKYGRVQVIEKCKHSRGTKIEDLRKIKQRGMGKKDDQQKTIRTMILFRTSTEILYRTKTDIDNVTQGYT